MRLKKITIMGFKSFADKTHFPFVDGITCIVGPNGCGKSNVADAFRWVLGEQSAKSLRGNKMPDVIFAGTTTKKPLNLAEVSLTLTDIQGVLPIDYEEVILTRRLHRSGESEYLLNGHSVRLKDLQGLLLDTGVGKNSFSIFEQGKIDQVIQFTPLERRFIFEEAAGIVRFQQRKKDAMKRLEQADLNYSRAKDIHQEVEKQIKTLEVQSEKALRYKSNQISLERHEKALLTVRCDEQRRKANSFAEKARERKAALEPIQKELEASENEGQRLYDKLSQVEKVQQETQQKHYQIQSQKSVQEEAAKGFLEKIDEIQKRKNKLKMLSEEIAKASLVRIQQMEEIATKLGSMHDLSEELAKTLLGDKERVKQKEQEVFKLREQLKSIHRDHVQKVEHEKNLLSLIKQIEVRIESAQDHFKRMENRNQELVQSSKTAEETIQQKKAHLATISANIDRFQKELQGITEQLKTIKGQQETLGHKTDEFRRKRLESQAREKALLRLKEELEGFSSGTKRLLNESKKRKNWLSGPLKPLYDYISSNSSDSAALAALLRPYEQTLVVESVEDFITICQWAEKEKIEDYSIACLELLNKLPLPENRDPDAFITEKTSHPLAQRLLHPIKTADDYVQAIETMHICGAGELLVGQGALIDTRGIYFKMPQECNQPFLRESELKGLAETIAECETQLKELEGQLKELEQTRSKLQQQRFDLDKQLRTDEMKLVEVNFALQQALAEVTKNQHETEKLKNETKKLHEQVEQQKLNLEQCQSDHELAKQQLKQAEETRELHLKSLEAEELLLSEQQQQHKSQDDRFRQFSEEKKQLHHQQHLLQSKNEDAKIQEIRCQEESLECDAQLKLTHNQIKEGQTVLAKLNDSLILLQKEIDALAVNRQELKRQVGAHKEQYLKLQDKQKKIEAEESQLHIQIAQAKALFEELCAELTQRYGISLDEAHQLDLPLDLSKEAIDAEIKTLRAALQSEGDVNLAAIEELVSHRSRIDFLSQQMGDMQQSRYDLMQVIKQLDEESRHLFKQTFEQIRANFRKNIQLLFLGGEADLHFTEGDDLLEAGIEIVVRPPGKQMRSISLLSGGEKCLTALALLFAIFEVKPAPFCILDEIDAPLDDANVDRFLQMVGQFSEQSQFLIITHNKSTMAKADTLFGISMEEKGVSKLLTLNMKKPVEQTAHASKL